MAHNEQSIQDVGSDLNAYLHMAHLALLYWTILMAHNDQSIQGVGTNLNAYPYMDMGHLLDNSHSTQ